MFLYSNAQRIIRLRDPLHLDHLGVFWSSAVRFGTFSAVKPAVNRQPGYRRGTRRAFSDLSMRESLRMKWAWKEDQTNNRKNHLSKSQLLATGKPALHCQDQILTEKRFQTQVLTTEFFRNHESKATRFQEQVGRSVKSHPWHKSLAKRSLQSKTWQPSIQRPHGRQIMANTC